MKVLRYRNTILQGDALKVLSELPDGIVQTCVTSPPYWGLRDYGVPGQLGLEPTPEEYVERMVEVFREVRRALRDDGTLWLNLGDSYFSGTVGDSRTPEDRLRNTGLNVARDRSVAQGCGVEVVVGTRRVHAERLKPKDLCGMPWRVAFALQADGWWLRSDIIWSKPNPMPESVRDRPTKAHEYLFLLAKSKRYYYDADAVRESAVGVSGGAPVKIHDDSAQGAHGSTSALHKPWTGSADRNRRTVWEIATKPFSGAHFAVFPPDLIKPCILAGTSERGCCAECGAPWERVTERVSRCDVPRGSVPSSYRALGQPQRASVTVSVKTHGWQPTCACDAGTAPCLVLDPFMGAGTTALVAWDLGRDYLGIELNEEYIDMANARLQTLPLRLSI